MSDVATDVIVVGSGIGGRAAAVAALEEGRWVTILERSPQEERGAPTRYTEAHLRMKSEASVSNAFEDHLAQNGSGAIDPSLIAMMGHSREDRPSVAKGLSLLDPDVITTFAEQAPPPIAWLKRFALRFEALPTQLLTRSRPPLLPVGGGLVLVETLAGEADRFGAQFFYETTALDLVVNNYAAGEITGSYYRNYAGGTSVLTEPCSAGSPGDTPAASLPRERDMHLAPELHCAQQSTRLQRSTGSFSTLSAARHRDRPPRQEPRRLSDPLHAAGIEEAFER